MKTYTIPKNLKKGDVVEIMGIESEIIDICKYKTINAASTIPRYKIIYKNKEGKTGEIIKDGYTVFSKILKPKIKKRGLSY